MILQSLYRLYDRLREEEDYAVPSKGYSVQQIVFRVVITYEGELVDIQDIRISSGKLKRSRQLLVPGGTKPSGSGLNPGFLWDNTAYMLGYKKDDNNLERTRESFNSFKKKHLSLEREINSKAFSAVCHFLEKWRPQEAMSYSFLEEGVTGFGVFQIQGEMGYVHEDPVVRAWWEKNQHKAGKTEEIGQCLITGHLAPVARLHEPKIKGVRGAQSSGGLIVSFNESAYESYGRKQSRNAPVSVEAAFKYTNALNALLNGPMSEKHSMMISDTTVVFWTEKPTPTEDIFIHIFSGDVPAPRDVMDEGLRQKIEVFLNALKKGKKAYEEIENDPDHTTYYMLGLSPNAARISVRFFHTGTLGSLLENLKKHNEDISIQREHGEHSSKPDPEFPPLWLLLRQTSRESKEIPPILAAPLLRAVITGTHYPEGLFTSVMRRVHVEREVNYYKACIIKGYLNRNLNREVTMSLDKNRKDPSYRLGRLFATLEKTQQDALGNLNASIRERFYSSASATPRSVFPRLLRTYQHHLAKLEGGHKVNREKLVQEILAPVEDFPAHLSLADQGLFALGYYHQMRDFYTHHETNGSNSKD